MSKRRYDGDNTGIHDIKKYVFEITEKCLETLNAKKQIGHNEDCGIIFASQISEKTIRINAISESCCTITSARKYSCTLDTVKANRMIKQEFEKSNNTRFYIGEWHTHPEDFPSPSCQDYRSLRESYKKNNIVIPNLILMSIVGRMDISWIIYDGNKFSNIKPKKLFIHK